MTTALWTQKEAALNLRVSTAYLRQSGCPKVLLPSLKPDGKPMVRYVPSEVEKWFRQHHTDRGWAA